MTVPSFVPAEEPSPSGQRAPLSARSEGPHACTSLSALYDDLQLSSSSEDSDGQRDPGGKEDLCSSPGPSGGDLSTVKGKPPGASRLLPLNQ